VSAGYSQTKDENVHPKVFHGAAVDLSFTHSKIGKNISEYSIGLELSDMNTVYENFPSATGYLLRADYQYLFSVVHNADFDYCLGPLVDMEYGASDYYNWDESHLYYANYICGGFANRIYYNYRGHFIRINLDIPLVSCICRPENNRQYKYDDMSFSGIFKTLSSNPELALPNHFFFVDTGVDFYFFSKKKKPRSIGYDFGYYYMKAEGGNAYRHIGHSITYKIIF
jgi:hypothetical protein